MNTENPANAALRAVRDLQGAVIEREIETLHRRAAADQQRRDDVQQRNSDHLNRINAQ